MIREFGLKFTDIILGVILGLGFQWWPALSEPWQYLAFVFVYLNLIDFWIDYTPALKRFPLKNEIDVFIHTLIFFAMFFLIYTTQGSIVYFFGSYLLYRIGDIIWITRVIKTFRPPARDMVFWKTWLRQDAVEVLVVVACSAIAMTTSVSPLVLIVVFILARVLTRIYSSVAYQKVYYDETK